MAGADQLPPPPGRGEDPLTEFLELAYRNRFATFFNKKKEMADLVAIDRCFHSVTENWLDPANKFTPFLLHRSHAAYRAACEHALAAQVSEAFPLMRLELECAAYALHIQVEPKRAEIFLKRQDNDETRKAMRREFAQEKLLATIGAAHSKSRQAFALLYERTIDFGAHPNELSVTGSMKVIEAEKHRLYNQLYLHDDGPALDHVLRSAAQCGLCAPDILEHASTARFEETGVSGIIAGLKTRL